MATQFCVHSKTIEQFKWINCKKYILYLSKANKKSTIFLLVLNTKWSICTIRQTVLLIGLFFPSQVLRKFSEDRPLS